MAATFSDVCAVVPAAGFGRRMQTECPKQYLSIGDKTILEHAVAALLAHARVKRVVFPRELLHDCLTRALKEGATITDEASALEYCGFHPTLVEGRADNIKVTRPEDLQLAEFYLTRTTPQEKA